VPLPPSLHAIHLLYALHPPSHCLSVSTRTDGPTQPGTPPVPSLRSWLPLALLLLLFLLMCFLLLSSGPMVRSGGWQLPPALNEISYVAIGIWMHGHGHGPLAAFPSSRCDWLSSLLSQWSLSSSCWCCLQLTCRPQLLLLPLLPSPTELAVGYPPHFGYLQSTPPTPNPPHKGHPGNRVLYPHLPHLML